MISCSVFAAAMWGGSAIAGQGWQVLPEGGKTRFFPWKKPDRQK